MVTDTKLSKFLTYVRQDMAGKSKETRVRRVSVSGPQVVRIHDQAYEYLSWEVLGEEIFDLAQKILKNGKEYDRVIALAKGGLTFARSLIDYLDIPQLNSIQIEFYSGIDKTLKAPVVTQGLSASIKNESILIFDDLVDKGETMKKATEYLRFHGPEDIDTCCLITKPWATFKPDFFTHESKAWIIFPNESRETIQLLQDMWQEKGDSLEVIKVNLMKIGFPKAEVEFFTQDR
ncbi:phosphoribosyltransferase [soil metagenome]